jgi:hypothetical protein
MYPTTPTENRTTHIRKQLQLFMNQCDVDGRKEGWKEGWKEAATKMILKLAPLRVDPKAVAIYSVCHVSHTNSPLPHGLPLFVIVRHGPKIEGGGGNDVSLYQSHHNIPNGILFANAWQATSTRPQPRTRDRIE